MTVNPNVANIKLDTRRLDEIVRKLGGNTDQALKRIAFQVEAKTKYFIQAKHVIDTGAYFNSIEAERLNENTWWVHDGVEYGIWLELGHHTRKGATGKQRWIPGRPCLIPAVEDTDRQIAKICGEELFK